MFNMRAPNAGKTGLEPKPELKPDDESKPPLEAESACAAKAERFT
jgi:hypothetical protein